MAIVETRSQYIALYETYSRQDPLNISPIFVFGVITRGMRNGPSSGNRIPATRSSLNEVFDRCLSKIKLSTLALTATSRYIVTENFCPGLRNRACICTSTLWFHHGLHCIITEASGILRPVPPVVGVINRTVDPV